MDTRAISIVRDPDDTLATQPGAEWALDQLQGALVAKGVAVDRRGQLNPASEVDLLILATSCESAVAQDLLRASRVTVPATPEALTLLSCDRKLLACGRDVRGLVYAILELKDRVDHAEDPLQVLRVERPVVEQPANAIRSIGRLFSSEVEDKPWFYDRDFWRAYLTMLATQRINRFSLTLGLGYNFPRDIRDAYFYFPYPFFLPVPGYDVRVSGLPEEERDRNLELLRFISDEAARRSLHFQLALWSHCYEWVDSPDASCTIEGLTPDTHAPYCRDGLRELLQACPSVAGVTLRVHGESGVPEGSYEFWRTVFDGIVQCGREVEIDLHAKDIDQETIDLALATGMPVNVSPKYWAEHMGLPYHQASIREWERVSREMEGHMTVSAGSRRFTRYGYADLLKEDRRYGVLHRIWPGTQRVLLWGDPLTAAAYGRASSFCDSLGIEIWEPLSFKGRMGTGVAGDRNGYSDPSLRTKYDWEKHLYTYRLWGRLTYNPDADPDVWRRFLRYEHGDAAEGVERALANASRVLPLITVAHHPAASNNSYWPEMYTNMPIVDEARPHPYRDTPDPKRFGTVTSLDPVLFAGVDEFVDELVQGRRSGKVSPFDVADCLEVTADAADKHLADAEAVAASPDGPAFRRMAVDVAIQAGLGRFFAHKLRAGVWHSLFRRVRGVKHINPALRAYGAALREWKTLSQHGEVYAEDLAFGTAPHLRGHWRDRKEALMEDQKDLLGQLALLPAKPKSLALQPLPTRPRPRCRHEPPASFHRGDPLGVELVIEAGPRETAALSVRLHYRHVNQAEQYSTVEMTPDERGFHGTIPSEYTDSPYPLQYFFVLRTSPSEAWLYPGFDENLLSQPYLVVRQA